MHDPIFWSYFNCIFGSNISWLFFNLMYLLGISHLLKDYNHKCQCDWLLRIHISALPSNKIHIYVYIFMFITKNQYTLYIYMYM